MRLVRNDILGINARNLLYIRPFNRARAIQLADSKLKTKLLLGARGIPVPALLGAIRSPADLEAMDWNGFQRSFVVKPNRGYGGEGILVTKIYKSRGLTDLHNRPLEREELDAHVRNILDGRYSIDGLPDIAVIEEKIIPPPFLKKLAPIGLPDIRVIVFNLVPVLAMLRLPTSESDGKANLHQGGIAVGLDLSTGTGTYAYRHGTYVEEIEGVSVRSIAIPGWERILLVASRTQRISNVGYLAVDIALTKREKPVVLEMNARGGLTIQLACRVPLRGRLERVAGLKVQTPERGVRLAQELFGAQIEREIERVSGREVLGRVEPVALRLPKGRSAVLLAQIDPGKLRTYLDVQTARTYGLLPEQAEDGGYPAVRVRFTLGSKDVRSELRFRDLSVAKYKMLIGTRDLVDFLIDPLKKVTQLELEEDRLEAAGPRSPMRVIEPHIVDDRLREIEKQLVVMRQMRPLNIVAERERFLVDPTTNPQFVYRPFEIDVATLRRELEDLATGPGALGELFATKRAELLQRIELLQAVGTEHFTDASLALYGVGSLAAQEEVRTMTITPPPSAASRRDQAMKIEDVKAELEAFFATSGLDWTVRTNRDQVTDFVASKEGSVSIRKGAIVLPDRLRGTIAHEIETHAYTAENGRLQPYKIFHYGFAHFLLTQEGLADTIKFRTVPEELHWSPWSLVNYRAILEARERSFAEVAAWVQSLGVPLLKSFDIALRVKRGMTDTSKPGAFTKDAVYWLGRKNVDAWADAGGDLRELFIGKVNIDQMHLVRQIPGLVAPKYLPQCLRDPSTLTR